MKIITTYVSLQEIGQRTNQEDSIYPALGQAIPRNDLFILCDGMGGHENGEVASQTVCQAMSAYIHANPDTDFESALDAAYDALDEKDDAAEKKMGTTLTFVKFDEGQCLVAHIGDSRVYHIRPSEKRILYVTHDHSLLNDLIACEEITPEEAKQSRQKNVITRAMQPHQERRSKADVAILTDIQAGDYFYMCSDGMLEISEDEDIVNILAMDKTDEQKRDIFKGVTRNNKDNHSAHIIHVTAIEDDSPSASNNNKQNNSRRLSMKRLLYGIAILLLVVLLAVSTCKHWRPFKKKALPPMDSTQVDISKDVKEKETDEELDKNIETDPSVNDLIPL